MSVKGFPANIFPKLRLDPLWPTKWIVSESLRKKRKQSWMTRQLTQAMTGPINGIRRAVLCDMKFKTCI